ELDVPSLGSWILEAGGSPNRVLQRTPLDCTSPLPDPVTPLLGVRNHIPPTSRPQPRRCALLRHLVSRERNALQNNPSPDFYILPVASLAFINRDWNSCFESSGKRMSSKTCDYEIEENRNILATQTLGALYLK
ncbi:hypothetical protein STEG23_006112, partial [Scotinomys teguina]